MSAPVSVYAQADVRVDVVVVGGGVVGLAVAVAFVERGQEVVVLERRARCGQETTARNSEVIHAGVYYPPGSLKARLCLEGREALYDLCAAHGVAHRRIGKLIVAPQKEAVSRLADLQRNAAACGVTDLVAIEGRDIARFEPRVRGAAALLSPSTGIIDAHGLVRHYQGRLQRGGGALALRTTAERVEPHPGGLLLRARTPEGSLGLLAPIVVVAGGMDTDRLLRASGVSAGVVPDHVPVKGEYFLLRRAPVSRLVYPMPVAAGLGVHVTLDLGGAARLGPNTVPLCREEVDQPGVLDVDPGHGPDFLAAARSYLPDLELAELSPGYAGIRPRRCAAGFGDFLVQDLGEAGLPGLIALVGIESPGLTAAPALARLVCDLAG